MGAIDHVAVVGQTRQRAGDHVVDGVQVGVRRGELRFRTVVGADRQRPEILPAGRPRQSAHLGVAEGVVVELVGEAFAVAVAAGDVGVALPLVGEAPVGLRRVAVRDLDARAGEQLFEIGLQPSGDDPSEVEPPDAGGRFAQFVRQQPLLHAVGLDRLGRCAVAGLVACDHRPPVERGQIVRSHRARVAPRIDLLAAEVEGVPRPRVAVAAQRRAPGEVRAADGLPRAVGPRVDLRPHERFGVGLVGLPAAERAAFVPSLSEPDHHLVHAFAQVGRGVVGHPQRAFVELREGRSEAGVARLAAVDPDFVVTQRIDVQQGRIPRFGEVEPPAQQHGRGSRAFEADEPSGDGRRVREADAEAGDRGDDAPAALFGADRDAPPALRAGPERTAP